ncbi:STAM-binding protein-like [Actinia tenebrosa]|uniref:STAM-binding protein-like n=1 Tax=Actinia tenebrosa TaxID=6105 RepID=A0A6P8INW4_ACTTE|nr:STAM-binding protein-like [Actinia tenebrosa]
MADNEECKTPAERIRLLSHYASLIEVDNDIPPKRYFRSGLEMERMANVYLDERNYESAFVLYTKFITLFVEKLPHHIEYAKASPQEKAENKKKLKVMFKVAEELKRILTERYEKEYQTWQEKKRLAEEEERRKKEEERREEERKQAEQQMVQELEDREKKKKNAVPTKPPDVAKIITPPPLQSTLIGDFPIPPTLGQVDESSIKNEGNEREHITPNTEDIPLRRPDTPSLYSVDTRPPSVDRSAKPLDSTCKSGLRAVSVPSDLARLFLEIASPNTRQNKETCGILTGKLKQNKFYITHLVIPKQSATPDSCTTLNEEDLFEFQDSHDLITLGWIHTHPSQTAFMSSVDLHTHCSYQLMMPEAIAIVCSPKFNETGVFSLIQGYGLKFISSCKKSGFHPHPKEPPLYQESDHVIWEHATKVEVVDLRRR